MTPPLLAGLLLGFISAIPVAGPVSAVIFSRGLRGKYTQGRWIACGTGLAEGLYTFTAFWGFNHFLADLRLTFIVSKLVAALILGVLGVYFYRSRKLRNPIKASPETPVQEEKAFLLGAGMSLVNPTLIATWTVVATTLFSMKLFEFSNVNFALFAGGVCFGIIVWFSLMMTLMEKHLDQLNQKTLDIGLKAMGVGLTSLSVWIFISTLSRWLF